MKQDVEHLKRQLEQLRARSSASGDGDSGTAQGGEEGAARQERELVAELEEKEKRLYVLQAELDDRVRAGLHPCVCVCVCARARALLACMSSPS